MKIIKNTWIILSIVLVLGLSLTACSGAAGPAGPEGPVGPAGPAGPPGKDAPVPVLETEPEVATITGFVVDNVDGGIKGATVSVEGQSITADTAADGSFELKDVPPGPVFLYVTTPSDKYLDGDTRNSIFVSAGATVADVKITLSNRPSDAAVTIGMKTCEMCHASAMPEMFAAFDGSPDAAAHSRFITEGTSDMVYTELWPVPGGKYLPLNSKGELLMVQDPLDGKGLVNLVLCTQDAEAGRDYIFKFYQELAEGAAPRSAAALNCANDATAVFIPVGATIGGQAQQGEGYVDPNHEIDNMHDNFGEGKQRYMARIQDVPYLVTWFEENGIPLDRAKQDYVPYMPVYLMQDGTPEGSDILTGKDVGTPKFWPKSPEHWVTPDNTLSRNCAGCHATGLEIAYEDFTNGDETFKSVVTAFDYKDLNITCERCHGPGSEHVSAADKVDIINPKYLTAQASNELCGQCHASHAGKSASPNGIFKYPFDETFIDTLGNGFFVPGVNQLETFYANYNLPTINNDWKEGSVHTWADQLHSRAHSQMLPELEASVHLNNPYEKLTCYSCHNAHTLAGGPASMVIEDYEFVNPDYANNTLCLACHATHGPFELISKADVAVIQIDAGRTVNQNGEALTFEVNETLLARNRVAKAVAKHMQDEAGMGGAIYTPANPDSPVGSCTSCHMAQIGKLFDPNDDAQYHLAPDLNGNSAVAFGNVGSHVFDIVWPAQSAVLVNPDLSAGHDYDIMPNSCSACHAFARISGDND